MATTQRPQVLLSAQDYRNQEVARSLEEARTLQADTTVPGGVYIVNGQAVNANGVPIGEGPGPTEQQIRDEAERRFYEQRNAEANIGRDQLRAEEQARIAEAQRQRIAEENAAKEAEEAKAQAAKQEAEEREKAEADAKAAEAQRLKDEKAAKDAAAKAEKAAADKAAKEAQGGK